jgi:hypothetical protein
MILAIKMVCIWFAISPVAALVFAPWLKRRLRQQRRMEQPVRRRAF